LAVAGSLAISPEARLAREFQAPKKAPARESVAGADFGGGI